MLGKYWENLVSVGGRVARGPLSKTGRLLGFLGRSERTALGTGIASYEVLMEEADWVGRDEQTKEFQGEQGVLQSNVLAIPSSAPSIIRAKVGILIDYIIFNPICNS